MDNRILLLESSDFFGRAIKYRLETKLGYQVLWYKTLNKFINPPHDMSKITLAIIDYTLTDSSDGEILNLCHENNIPIILLSDEITHHIQEKIWNLKVIDYVLKGTNHSLDSVVDVTSRYFNNSSIGILVVDDSIESRNHLKKLLKMHRYTVYEASSSEEALDVLNDNYNKIQLVITDHNMPELDGLSLTSQIRKSYPVDRLSIIGISSQGNHTLKIQFIKSGANDFLGKPFISELLYCRITQTLKVVEYFQKIKDLAIIDQLTKLNNRHFLKETGSLFFENARRHKLSLVAAMIDIDDFKKVNDTYGHDAGDVVLKEISTVLKDYVRKSDLVIRYGGEEFLILGNNLDPNHADKFFNTLRTTISRKQIEIGSDTISVTVSIGLCTLIDDTLEQSINKADIKLYEAKTTGKNKVCS